MDTISVNIESLSPGTGPAAYRDPGCPEPLFASLREQGQTLPLLAAERPSGFVIVSGHRRCHGLRRLGQLHAKVSVVKAPRDIDLLRISVLENSTSAGFNDLERARVLHFLVHTNSIELNTVVTEWMPWLGLEPSTRLLTMYAFFGREKTLHDGLRTGSITIGLGKGLIRFDPSEIPLLAQLLDSSGLSISEKRELLYTMDELKRRDKISLVKLIDEKQSTSLLVELRARRSPQAMRRKEQLKELARGQPEWLTYRETATEGLEARIVFRGIRELRDRARELLRLSKDPAIADIIEKF